MHKCTIMSGQNSKFEMFEGLGKIMQRIVKHIKCKRWAKINKIYKEKLILTFVSFTKVEVTTRIWDIHTSRYIPRHMKLRIGSGKKNNIK